MTPTQLADYVERHVPALGLPARKLRKAAASRLLATTAIDDLMRQNARGPQDPAVDELCRLAAKRLDARDD